MIKGLLSDGEGSGVLAGITDEHALKVSIVSQKASTIPVAQLIRQKQLRRFLVDSGGSKDMNVDGSTTPVEFVETTEANTTKWVTAIRILLHGTNMEIDTNDFRRFGLATAASTPLTNGIELFVDQEGVVTDLVAEPVTTLGEFLSYADSFTNLRNTISTQSDFVSFDMVFDVPVVLPPAATDRIVCRINDDLTAVDLFQVLARGYQEIAETT